MHYIVMRFIMAYEQYRNNDRLREAAFRYCEIVGLNPEAEPDQDKFWWMVAKDISHHMAMSQAIAETEPSVIETPVFIPHEVAAVVSEGVDDYWAETNKEVYETAKRQVSAMGFVQVLAEHVAMSDWDLAAHACDDAKRHFEALRNAENQAADESV